MPGCAAPHEPLVTENSERGAEGDKRLLSAKADPNATDKGGATALQYARRNGYKDIAEMLLAAGAKDARSAPQKKSGL